MFAVQRTHHRFLVDPQDFTIRHRSRGSHALGLACQRALAKEVSLTQYPDSRFPAGLGNDGELHFAFLDIEDRVRRIPLREDSLLFGKSQVLPALANGCEEGVGIELAAFLIRLCRGAHSLPILILKDGGLSHKFVTPHRWASSG